MSSAGNGGNFIPEYERAAKQNDFVQWYNSNRGYVSCELTPEKWKTYFRATPFVTKKGSPLETKAVFMIEEGRPGRPARLRSLGAILKPRRLLAFNSHTLPRIGLPGAPLMGTHGNQMKTTLTRILRFKPSRLLLAGLIFATPLMARAKDHQTASAMAQAATRLLALSTPGSRAMAYSFENETREVWHFFPNWPKRSGIPLEQVVRETARARHEDALPAAYAEGFKEQEKVRLIHGLKKDLNAPDNPRHHYFISIFGQPSVESTWGWR